MCLRLGLCVQYRRSAPRTVARIGDTESAWSCRLGREPKDEELIPAPASSHIQGIIHLFFIFFYLKKSQCQEEQNIIKIAVDNN